MTTRENKSSFIIKTIVTIIANLMLANFISGIFKLFHFLIPGFKAEDDPNLLLFAAGNGLALYAIIKISNLIMPKDPFPVLISIALYLAYVIFMLIMVPEMPWYLFVIAISLGLGAWLITNKRNKPNR